MNQRRGEFPAGAAVTGSFQPGAHEIQAEHIQEQRVEQHLDNLRWLVAAPDSRQSQQTDQIVNAALKTLDLLGRIFDLLSISGRRG